MGNAAWGHGYNRGFGEGSKRTGLIVTAIGLGVTIATNLAQWQYGKHKAKRLALQDAEAVDTVTPPADAQGGPVPE